MSNWNQLNDTWKQVMNSAFEAYLENSIPVGAAIVDEYGEVVSVGRNKFSQDRIAHAETESLRNAPPTLNRKQASIYSSMEPCPMCTGAIRMMQLKNLYMAARDPAAGSTALLNASEFMRYFECQVVSPTNPTLEFVNVAIVLEHRTRNGHKRWRENWFSYLPKAVETGETLAASGQYQVWLDNGRTAHEIYDQIASYFR